jgi:hypothetical protein
VGDEQSAPMDVVYTFAPDGVVTRAPEATWARGPR